MRVALMDQPLAIRTLAVTKIALYSCLHVPIGYARKLMIQRLEGLPRADLENLCSFYIAIF
ncbi:MAG: hypothetical protein QW748_03750 [Candidatus Methanomethylicaceae archaeon]